jgi:oxaloacetate decarboxylase alpha subunit
MRIGAIKKLIRLVEESRISELEVSRFGTRVKISKNGPATEAWTGAELDGHDAGKEKASQVKSRRESLAAVAAPMVGTFYRAPAPDAPPYVENGDYVKKGQVLCLIEAMKLMNEIECEFDGRVAEILVKNEQPVAYGQELFLIERAL